MSTQGEWPHNTHIHVKGVKHTQRSWYLNMATCKVQDGNKDYKQYTYPHIHRLINLRISYSSSSSISSKSTCDFVELLCTKYYSSRKSKSFKTLFVTLDGTLVLYGTHKSRAVDRDNLYRISIIVDMSFSFTPPLSCDRWPWHPKMKSFFIKKKTKNQKSKYCREVFVGKLELVFVAVVLWPSRPSHYLMQSSSLKYDGSCIFSEVEGPMYT